MCPKARAENISIIALHTSVVEVSLGGIFGSAFVSRTAAGLYGFIDDI